MTGKKIFFKFRLVLQNRLIFKKVIMKSTLYILLIVIVFSSCKQEDCITCIAESQSGKIIETRLACDSDSEYLRGFINGFKDKHSTNDSTTVHCAYSE